MVKIIHSVERKKLTLAQKAADLITKKVGSWIFILIFILFLTIWISTNTYFLVKSQTNYFDPFPFAFLNLILAAITALQVPIILMSQNRQEERDRQKVEYDYEINRKAEREIEIIKKQLDKIERKLK